jgi:hypothetical protein
MMRGLMVLSALAPDTSRESRRAQAAIVRSRFRLERATAPRERKSSPNWLKMALNAQR